MSDLSIKHCSKCGTKTLINDSRIRIAKGAHMQRLARRRYCPKCGHKFSTVEILQHEYDDLVRVKRMIEKLANPEPEPEIKVEVKPLSKEELRISQIRAIAERKKNE